MMSKKLSYKELVKTEFYQSFSNSPDIMRMMGQYQEGNISRRKLCEEIVRLMNFWGFIHKSEIRFPEEVRHKDTCDVNVIPDHKTWRCNCGANKANNAISETKKLNGVSDEV